METRWVLAFSTRSPANAGAQRRAAAFGTLGSRARGRTASCSTSVLLAIALLALATPAVAPIRADDLDDQRAALLGAKQAAADAEAHAAALNQQAEDADSDAAKARARASALAMQVQAAQSDIAAAQARIGLIAALQQTERARIADKQGPILHLVAALQTLARRPPALAIAQPGSIDDIVHVRLLLADTLPVIAARTASLREDLDRQTQLRGDAERAVSALAASRHLLDQRKLALARVEATAIRRSQRLADQAADEQERALGLGEEARDITDRMQTMSDAGDVRARLARLPGPDPRPDGSDDALPAHAGTPRYRLPVAGEVTGGFGEVSPSGVRARGLTIATDGAATVTAPATATVVFAGPFRSYGRVVILAHGGGWTTTLTGLDTLAVKQGDHIAQGAPVGRAQAAGGHVTTELRRADKPIDIVAMTQGG
jgi:septal ring factor EnvC (AmiA/AmiB activator)